MTRWVPAAALASLLAAAVPAHAQFRTDLDWDRVDLRNGRSVRGSARWEGKTLHVRLPLGELSVPAKDVRAVAYRHDPFDELARLEREGYPAGTITDRVRYARFCAHYGFKARARRAWLSLLRLDPDHAEARRALGFELVDGKWLTHADANRARGLVEFRGKWRTPAAVARILAEERKDRLARARRRRAEESARLDRELRAAKLRAAEAVARAARAKEAAARAQVEAAARVETPVLAPVIVIRRRHRRRATTCYPRPRPVRRPRPCSSRPIARPRRRPRPVSSRPLRPKPKPPTRYRRPRPAPRTGTTRATPAARGYYLRHEVPSKRSKITINKGPGVR